MHEFQDTDEQAIKGKKYKLYSSCEFEYGDNAQGYAHILNSYAMSLASNLEL